MEVELEEDDHVTTVNEADITCAIDGLFAAEGQVVEGQREKGEAGGDGPSSTRKWSSIWMHYECLENQKCAMCLLCMEKLYHHSSTSNLHRHLSKRHPEVVARLGGIIKKRPSKAVKHTPSKAGSSKPSKKILVKEKFSGRPSYFWCNVICEDYTFAVLMFIIVAVLKAGYTSHWFSLLTCYSAHVKSFLSLYIDSTCILYVSV